MGAAELTQQACIAIREGRLADARSLLRQVTRQDPHNHAAWLLLAQATPSNKLASQYIERARLLQPDSPLVRSAQEKILTRNRKPLTRRLYNWRLASIAASLVLILGLLATLFGGRSWDQVTALQNEVDNPTAAIPSEIVPQVIETNPQTGSSRLEMPSDPEIVATEESRTPTYRPSLVLTLEAISLPVDISDPDQALPAAILSGLEAEASTNENVFISENQAKEASTTRAVDDSQAESTREFSDTAEDGVDEEIASNEENNQEQLEPTFEVVSGGSTGSLLPGGGGAEQRWIDVNLTTQTLTAYEGETLILSSLISSGMWQFPTVTGQFKTWMKYESQNMTGYHLGYNYSLPDVPHVMYFFEDYAIHGAYWHNNFGTPMSHGCVNMNPVDAGWLFDWAPLGTVVNVHY